MTEREYIIVADLHRVWSAIGILREMSPSNPVVPPDRRKVFEELQGWADAMFNEVEMSRPMASNQPPEPPERIYLQTVNSYDEPEELDYWTWSVDQINDTDLAYRRETPDDLSAAVDELTAERDAYHEDVERLATTQARWVPVTEQLPSKPGEYLVLDENSVVDFVGWDDDGMFDRLTWESKGLMATHWLDNVPPPPEGT